MSEPPKLLDRMGALLRTEYYSIHTEDAYVQWEAVHFFEGKRHPSSTGAPETAAASRRRAGDPALGARGREAGRSDEGNRPAHAAALVRHASAGSGTRHPDGAGAAGPFGRATGHPYYTFGDFNSDGIEDLAVAAIDRTEHDTPYVLAVFNGPFRRDTPAFSERGLNLVRMSLFYFTRGSEPRRLLLGRFFSEGALLQPFGSSYRWDTSEEE
jgi:hypothetical protein